MSGTPERSLGSSSRRRATPGGARSRDACRQLDACPRGALGRHDPLRQRGLDPLRPERHRPSRAAPDAEQELVGLGEKHGLRLFASRPRRPSVDLGGRPVGKYHESLGDGMDERLAEETEEVGSDQDFAAGGDEHEPLPCLRAQANGCPRDWHRLRCLVGVVISISPMAARPIEMAARCGICAKPVKPVSMSASKSLAVAGRPSGKTAILVNGQP